MGPVAVVGAPSMVSVALAGRRTVSRALPPVPEAPAPPASFTAGGFQVPSRIDGSSSLGQYIRSVRRNGPFGAGSQLASLSLPGGSFWKYSVREPSALYFGLSRRLTVNRFSGLGTNHQPWSISYMVIDQKPSTGGVWPLGKVSV